MSERLVRAHHPARETFARVSSLGPHLAVEPGPAGGEGWLTARELLREESGCLDMLLRHVSDGYGTADGQVLASFFMHAYSWPLVAAGLACTMLERRLPDLSVDNVALRIGAGARPDAVAFLSPRLLVLPDDPAAAHSDCAVVPDVMALRESFRQMLEAHMQEVITALRRRLPWGERALWLTVADRCAAALVWLHEHAGASALPVEAMAAELEALTRRPGSPLNNPLTRICAVEDGVSYGRGSCCLAYKLPGRDTCQNCPIRLAAARAG